jgi:hypothetical protein
VNPITLKTSTLCGSILTDLSPYDAQLPLRTHSGVHWLAIEWVVLRAESAHVSSEVRHLVAESDEEGLFRPERNDGTNVRGPFLRWLSLGRGFMPTTRMSFLAKGPPTPPPNLG